MPKAKGSTSQTRKRRTRVLYVHWNEEELAARVARLKGDTLMVTPCCQQGGEGLRELRAEPPDAIVIELTRLPSHGLAVATFLRQQKATRHVPLIFVDGAAEKVARVRGQLPDATFCTADTLRSALSMALRNRPATPVVPNTMAAYSGTPLPKKLGIGEESKVLLLGAPPDLVKLFEGFVPKDRLRTAARGKASCDIVVLSATALADLKRRLGPASAAMAERGRLWVAWPKKTSGMASDLSENIVRDTLLPTGLVDFKVCAIDATWSGLCFAWRARK